MLRDCAASKPIMMREHRPFCKFLTRKHRGVRALASRLLLNLATAHPIEDELECAKLLSSREREVFSLVAAGKLSKEIAATLAISTRTVETHRARIMLKLDLHSVSDLVRYAVRNNFIRF